MLRDAGEGAAIHGRPPHRRRRNGQAMVEFALTLPLLIVLAVSCFDYGYYLEHVDNIATVVRDGARYASENTTASPWGNACTNPSEAGSGNWSCAGLVTQVASTESGSVNLATILVSSVTGFTAFGSSTGFDVTTTNSAGTLVVINCTGTQSSPVAFTNCASTGSGNLVPNAYMYGESDYTEGVIQQEAESLTVPEGGLPIDNIDCCWSASSGGAGCPGGSGTTPVLGAAVVIPTAWPQSGLASGTPVSCMTISYWNSSDGSYSVSSLSLCGWYSADAADAGSATPFQSVGNGGNCAAAVGELVQVTVSYAWSQAAPGPAFAVLNSVFAINVNTSSTYSFVVDN